MLGSRRQTVYSSVSEAFFFNLLRVWVRVGSKALIRSQGSRSGTEPRAAKVTIHSIIHRAAVLKLTSLQKESKKPLKPSTPPSPVLPLRPQPSPPPPPAALLRIRNKRRSQMKRQEEEPLCAWPRRDLAVSPVPTSNRGEQDRNPLYPPNMTPTIPSVLSPNPRTAKAPGAWVKFDFRLP